MKRIAAICICALLSISLFAQRSFEVSNSADGQSVLYAYLPDASVATGRAVVCCPGGGYGFLAISYEGHWWQDFFNSRGIALFVLKYRMPNGDRSIPISDAENALATVRAHASEWNINPNDVGIMGFSAGGHLATMTATRSSIDVRPAFQILFYPVTTMNNWGGHAGSSQNFLGQDVRNPRIVNEYSADKQVKRHTTPPAIIFMAADDNVVPLAFNGMAYANAMMQAENEVAMHVYPSGGHGWNLGAGFKYADSILASLADWLDALPASRPDAVRVACLGDSITDGHAIFTNYRYGYPALLQDKLGDGYIVKNFGLSARCVLNKGDHPIQQEVCWQECLDFNPDVVVVKLGTNDSKPYNWEHKSEFKADMQSIVDQLKALRSHPKVYLCLPVHAYQNPYSIVPEVIDNEIVPAIREVAAQNGLEIIDLYSAVEDKALLQADNVHPNNRGVEVMADEVYKAISRN